VTIPPPSGGLQHTRVCPYKKGLRYAVVVLQFIHRNTLSTELNMNKITATFSNGKTISRNSKKAFAFAWYSENIYQANTGFAATADAARRAARSAFNGCPPAHTIEVVETQVA